MIRIAVTVAVVWLASTLIAEARPRHRVHVYAPTETTHRVPFLWFSQHICSFVAWSVAPDLPPDQQRLYLGACPPRPTFRT